MTYSKLLKDAEREFNTWEAQGKTVYCTVGETVFYKTYPSRPVYCHCGKRAHSSRGLCEFHRIRERGTRIPACACGKPAMYKGKCRPCYFKEYNRTRIRRKPLPKREVSPKRREHLEKARAARGKKK